MTDKRQKATKVKCKQEESLTKQSTFVEYNVRVLLELVGTWTQHYNTKLKSTRRHTKLDKIIFGTKWIPDLLCKHWFASSVDDIADVPLRETSLVAKGKEKQMFSQATIWKDDNFFSWAVRTDGKFYQTDSLSPSNRWHFFSEWIARANRTDDNFLLMDSLSRWNRDQIFAEISFLNYQ